ncbi:MAG: LysR family transcriptional regulator [Peptococcaceae bacterium]|nr:LysR family transcriptional regulator [Peptococcaceae bacterium]
MRFEQLEYVVTIAETQSFSAAAQKLFVTQQAISTSMKQLEQEVGQVLFIKENNKTLLTKAGEDVLTYAKETLLHKELLLSRLQVSSQEKKRYISIGSTSNVANLTLPSIIAELESKRRNTFFNIATMENMRSVLEQVREGTKDIGLISMNAEEFQHRFSVYREDLQMEILARDELVVVMNQKYYTGKTDYLEKEVYRNQLKTQFNLETLEKWKNSTTVPFSASSNDVEFHRAMLEKNNASVTMSGLSYQNFFNSKKYVALCLEDIDVSILHVAVYRKDADETIQDIVRMIRKEMHMK